MKIKTITAIEYCSSKYSYSNFESSPLNMLFIVFETIIICVICIIRMCICLCIICIIWMVTNANMQYNSKEKRKHVFSILKVLFRPTLVRV